MSDSNGVASLSRAIRGAIRDAASEFIGTGDFEGVRERVKAESEKYLAIYHGLGLMLHVHRVETEVTDCGRGIRVKFFDRRGNRVRP